MKLFHIAVPKGLNVQRLKAQCVARFCGARSFCGATAIMKDRVLTIDNMNPHVKKMEYAVRGPLVIRATAIEKELLAVSINFYLESN